LQPAAFRKALLRWYDSSRRDLPWRESRDFYRVWISEIMLQQTRVEAVIPYYARFLELFPSIDRLAKADEVEVLAAWSGLGYYSRARNLHRTAKQIAGKGRRPAYPATLEEVFSLPGVGPYTAAAIASIALGLPHAAVDGNVIRVISRLTNDASEVSSTAARRSFAEEAGRLLDRRRPGDFNQAMMELGATVCLPRNPVCEQCPVEEFCVARSEGTERELPVKLKKPSARDIPLDLVLLRKQRKAPGDTSVFLIQRSSSERRMAGFWELPSKNLLPRLRGSRLCEFSHRIVNDRFLVTIWAAAQPHGGAGSLPGIWFDSAELTRIPLTTVTKKALAAASTTGG
jgi:A/G-specific adenine glycosylase